MGFEETFTAYLVGKDLINKSFHFEYNRLKNDLNFCRHHRHNEASVDSHGDDFNQTQCHRCEWMFTELTTKATKMTDYFGLRVGQLVHLHFSPGMRRFLAGPFQYFKDDHEAALLHKGWMLIQFAVMNAIALRKILKKYDKVHESESVINFKSKLQAKHLDIMQSPWLIELVAMYMNLKGSDSLISDELFGPLSCDLNVSNQGSALTLTLLGSEKLECNLTCPICLDIVFQPYALSCGHIFCKSCACLAGHALIIEGFKSASPESKCPVCRESGVYGKPVCMSELGWLLKRRYKDGYKERLIEERKKILKQTKEYWELQTTYMIGM
ncbi:probable E3 ubiquitin-protein ligase BAH1-like isoform X1 [Lactuca sativa]|uniref:probable E3 ubiquitin-protein ligase BAH1-like isoform X1 n=1 Tax=Lactuca sativa TaxID=4236 RepID=UPI000CD869FF|nr:probable E3 ubiquitin-protein ligase BAH1-like isoform X1 [Lactuca sativa]